MTEKLFNTENEGIFSTVSLPEFGKQDRGYTPGGAADLFSMSLANILIGNKIKSPVLEMVFPPEIVFKKRVILSLTGGKREYFLIKTNGKKLYPEHRKAFLAAKGDRLLFGKIFYGFRTYLAYREYEKNERKILNKRFNFKSLFNWMDKDGKIRIVEGPENFVLKDKTIFFNNFWKTGLDMNNMGIRIRGEKKLEFDNFNMISTAVCDGTIQLTEEGPVILLRHRQTIGGYPRIYNVITADIDILGQFAPNQFIHFKEVNRETALKILKQKNTILQNIKKQ